jgi:hypothetical protein
MAEETTIGLLQEIRDLQKQQLDLHRATVANQQQALTNQETSLAVQREAAERQKLLVGRANRLWIFVFGAVFLLFFLAFFTTLLSTCTRVFLHR